MNFACCAAVVLGQAVQSGVCLTAERGRFTVPDSVHVPVVQRSALNSLVVSAKLGDRTVRFLVDTGAEITCIDERLANELKLPTHSQGGVQGIGTRHVPVRVVELKGLRLGSLPEMTPLVGVLDMSWANKERDRTAQLDVVGVLGSDILGRTGATVDFARSSLTLHDPVEWNRHRMQGEWRAVSVDRAGSAIDCTGLTLTVTDRRAVVRTGRATGPRVMAGKLDIFRDAVPGTYWIYEVEHLDPPLRTRQIYIGDVRFFVGRRELNDIVGRYDFRAGRLVMTLPSDMRGRGPFAVPDALHSPLLPSPAVGSLDLVTFERVEPSYAGRNIAAVAGWLAGGPRPVVRAGPWVCSVTPDWAVTGVDLGRRLRFTARPDGSVTFVPLRP